MSIKRTPVKAKVKQIIKYFRKERPNYNYLKEIFRVLRNELDVEVIKFTKKLPYVPTEEEIKKYYNVVWDSKNTQHIILIKLLLYTGIRVGEVVKIKISDIDFSSCQIKINKGKGNKDRIVLFPQNFKEPLVIHTNALLQKGASFLFESSWNRPYTDPGIRKILMQYTKKAGIQNSISPHKLRHFLLTWMKKQGIDDALIQPYSGHDSRKSLEIYSTLSIHDAQKEYEKAIKHFPV